MSIPNPELFSNWQDWAKSISRWSEQAEGLVEEDFGNYAYITDFYQDWAPHSANGIAYCKNKNSMVHIMGALYSSSSASLGIMFKVPDGIAPKLGIVGQNLYPILKNQYGVALTFETMLFSNPSRNFGQNFAVTSFSICYIDITYRTDE